jgi:hypothetical protein
VPAIASDMDRDPVSACLLANNSRGDNARLYSFTGLADGCDMVDVDVESCGHQIYFTTETQRTQSLF